MAWLHLFSSGIRPRYAQDAINLLSLPNGATYRFRYRKELLNARAQDNWRSLAADEAPVAIYYSLQHEADYFRPIYIPLRQGMVVSTLIEANVYIVDFRLDNFLPLKAAYAEETSAKQVQEFTSNLEAVLAHEHPGSTPRRAACLVDGGPGGTNGVGGVPSQGEAFCRVVDYLLPTAPFSEWLFFTVLRVGGGPGVTNA